MIKSGLLKGLRRYSTDWAVVELEMTKKPIVKLGSENKWAAVLGFNAKITESGDIIGFVIRL